MIKLAYRKRQTRDMYMYIPVVWKCVLKNRQTDGYMHLLRIQRTRHFSFIFEEKYEFWTNYPQPILFWNSIKNQNTPHNSKAIWFWELAKWFVFVFLLLVWLSTYLRRFSTLHPSFSAEDRQTNIMIRIRSPQFLCRTLMTRYKSFYTD